MDDREEPTAADAAEPSKRRPGLIAPWWHTALIVLLILGLSLSGAHHFRGAGLRTIHLRMNYSMTILYEWVLAALALWGARMRGVSLKSLLGEWRPGWRAWLEDLGVAIVFWIVALVVLTVVAQILFHLSGAHIDARKIGEVTEKLAPGTWSEMALFALLSLSAGVCEEFVFRGYLQQQFARIGGRIWIGVALSALVFGGAHGYEGIAGVVVIAVYGAMFGALVLMRRGLRTGMIAHAWHDIVSGAALMLMRHIALHH